MQKVLLVFHGLIGSIRNKELQEFYAKKNIRLIFVSRIGYGNSTYNEIDSYIDYSLIIQKLMNYLEIDRFSVFGISAGSIHAYSLCSILKSRVEKTFYL